MFLRTDSACKAPWGCPAIQSIRTEKLFGGCLDQPKQAKFLRNVKRVTHRRLPNHRDPIRGRALAAKQIDSEPFPKCRRAALQGGEWHTHGSVPNLRCRVDASCYDKTGVPGPTILVMRLRQVDIQIDPLPLRRQRLGCGPQSILRCWESRDRRKTNSDGCSAPHSVR